MADTVLTWDALDVFPEQLREPRERIDWPGRKRGGGKVAYGDSETILNRELEELGATTAVLQVAAGHDGFTRTGMLRANAKTEHPGVVLTVTRRGGETLTFATDLYLHWQDNVRAIALGLEGLRRLSRYGITRGDRQYTGWKALPAGESAPPPPPEMTKDEAVEIVMPGSGLNDAAWDRLPAAVRKTALREAVKNSHPDFGGSQEAAARVLTARAVLERD